MWEYHFESGDKKQDAGSNRKFTEHDVMKYERKKVDPNGSERKNVRSYHS